MEGGARRARLHELDGHIRDERPAAAALALCETVHKGSAPVTQLEMASLVHRRLLQLCR
jgi:hypothetical protein